jgi:hypothetical protein
VDLLSEESLRNPDFASKLERLIAEPPAPKARARSRATSATSEPPSDIHAEWNARGEADFRVWLRDQPVSVLRRVISVEDLDPTRRTAKWKEAEKLADFIADSLRARLARGSGFIGRADGE